jgi:two-component system chemotaxis response regulator CheY
MLIQIVRKNAEEMLIAELEAHAKFINRSILLCRFSYNHLTPPEAEQLVILMKELFSELDARLLYCHNGDLFIEWNGATKNAVETLTQMMRDYCERQGQADLPEDFFHYYDLNAHGEELWMECKRRKKEILESKHHSGNQKILAQFSEDQKQLLTDSILHRNTRSEPTILIVEDQSFSRVLMVSVLDKFYPCHIAKNGREAIEKYSLLAPNIVFLDIGLPDANGHDLAKLFKEMDPESYIVMATANHCTKDVLAAKSNGVDGFIVKPYNKQKILDSLKNYDASHKKEGTN